MFVLANGYGVVVRKKCGFALRFFIFISVKPHFLTQSRPWGVQKRGAVVFTLFLAILAYFVHFGAFLVKTRLFWAPTKRRQNGNRGHHAPRTHHRVHISTAGSLGDTNMHSLVCLWGLGAWCPRLPFCLRVVGAFKIRVFTKNAPKCTQYAKMAQNDQK